MESINIRAKLNEIDCNLDNPILLNMYDACILDTNQKADLVNCIKANDINKLTTTLTKEFNKQNFY